MSQAGAAGLGSTAEKVRQGLAAMKLFKCQHCGQIIYFENKKCEKCGYRLGYVHERAFLSALEPQDNAWRALGVTGKLYRFWPTPNSMFAIGWPMQPPPTATVYVAGTTGQSRTSAFKATSSRGEKLKPQSTACSTHC
jgi:zinc-ribbon domain